MNLTFAQNKDNLHVLECGKNFGICKPGFVFGKTTVDNQMKHGLAMCHKMASNSSMDGAIATIKKSKRNFSEKDQCQSECSICFQHVMGHPSNETLVFSVLANCVKNNQITKWGVKMALAMLD